MEEQAKRQNRELSRRPMTNGTSLFFVLYQHDHDVLTIQCMCSLLPSTGCGGGGTPNRGGSKGDRYGRAHGSGGGGGHRSGRRSRHGRRQRHYDSSSMSSGSSNASDSSDAEFQRYQRTKFKEDLDAIQPINGETITTKRGNSGSNTGGILDRYGKRDLSRADAMPMEVDSSIDWKSVGGLKTHITALKEMVMFPLLYPEYFHRFNVTPPRQVFLSSSSNQFDQCLTYLSLVCHSLFLYYSGVLFYGPPGTG